VNLLKRGAPVGWQDGQAVERVQVKVHSGHKASAVLDILNAGTTNGSLLQLYDCNGRPNQQWAIESGGEIVNPASGRCLTDPGNSTTDYTQIEIYDCSGAPGQEWTWSGSPVQSGIAGLCLDLYFDDTAKGTVINIYTCIGSAQQNWVVRWNDTLTIQEGCLDVTGSSKLDGALIDFGGCYSHTDTEWIIGPHGQLENVNSGLCLDDPGNTTTIGTQLVQEDCYGQPGEIWAVT
jgi:hypothetical protein